MSLFLLLSFILNFQVYYVFPVELHKPKIIVRHDKDESDFLKLAKRFEKTICHLNLPDCEGTLIADQWVISAAHCAIEIQDKLKANKTHFVIINNELIEVEKVIIHKNYKDDEAYDLGLIHLKKKSMEGVKANLYMDQDEVGKIVYIAGKGDKGNGLMGIDGNDGQLRAATNKVEEASDYWLKWVFDSPEKPNENLTEFEGISGPGDSGGPAFIIKDDKIYIAGISSGQSTRNSGGIEGVYGVKEYYVRISRYVEWIAMQTRITNETKK